MWAQIITTRIKPGKDGELGLMLEQLRASEQPDSGLLRTTVMRDQDDPSCIHLMVVFESEEKARAREADPRRHEALKAVRETMAAILDGPPEFRNLTVIEENTTP
jgi:quinol monooxygenase YgiN